MDLTTANGIVYFLPIDEIIFFTQIVVIGWILFTIYMACMFVYGFMTVDDYAKCNDAGSCKWKSLFGRTDGE